MSHPQLLFDKVTFYYDGLSDPVFDHLSLRLGPGFTGIVGSNGAGKSTLLRLTAGELVPQRGRVSVPGGVYYCAQRTDTPPAQLEPLMGTSDSRACRIRGRLQVDAAWPERWETLSHGERKRAQIAVALWQQPDVLSIDEPSNHIDEAGCALLIEILRLFHGIGLLVSHDRAFLDGLIMKFWDIAQSTGSDRLWVLGTRDNC